MLQHLDLFTLERLTTLGTSQNHKPPGRPVDPSNALGGQAPAPRRFNSRSSAKRKACSSRLTRSADSCDGLHFVSTGCLDFGQSLGNGPPCDHKPDLEGSEPPASASSWAAWLAPGAPVASELQMGRSGVPLREASWCKRSESQAISQSVWVL